MPATVFILAQDTDSGSVLFWSLALLAVLVVMFVVVTFIRKWMRGDDEEFPTGPGFTLGDLRDLYKRGQMTEEEFNRAKSALVVKLKAAETAKPATSDNPRDRHGGTPPGKGMF